MRENERERESEGEREGKQSVAVVAQFLDLVMPLVAARWRYTCEAWRLARMSADDSCDDARSERETKEQVIDAY